MKRIVAIVLVIGMAAFMAVSFAENSVEAVVQAEPLVGEGIKLAPDGENAENLLIRYRMPQFEAAGEVISAVNAYYRDFAGDLQADQGDDTLSLDDMDTLDLDYEVTHLSPRYVSIVLHGSYFYADSGAEYPTLEASTFALDGLYAGQMLTLSQVLGLEQEDDALSEKNGVAEEMAYRLVWELVAYHAQNADSGYLDDLTPERLREAFYPETDFYLDADGNVVFFIRSGEIAGEMAGTLTFPFAPEELLSADVR